jgi:hypothetical protein
VIPASHRATRSSAAPIGDAGTRGSDALSRSAEPPLGLPVAGVRQASLRVQGFGHLDHRVAAGGAEVGEEDIKHRGHLHQPGHEKADLAKPLGEFFEIRAEVEECLVG